MLKLDITKMLISYDSLVNYDYYKKVTNYINIILDLSSSRVIENTHT